MTSVVSADMQGAIGQELSRQVSYPVSASDIRRWALAIYWPDKPPAEYLSTDEANVTATEDFNPFGWAAASETLNPKGIATEPNDPDATEKALGIAGPGLKFQVNGGLEIEYGVPIKVGDVITGVRTLEGYTERDGKLGHMLFTKTATTLTNQRGEFVRKTSNEVIRY